MEFKKQCRTNSDNEKETQQEATFSFSSKAFYTPTSSTVQCEASENGHNEERCNSQASNVSSINFVDYVSHDKLDDSEHDDTEYDDPYHDHDHDTDNESESSLYEPTAEDKKMERYDDKDDLTYAEESKKKKV